MSSQFCKLAIVDGQLNLYMPDGTLVPEQISSHVVQSMDNASVKPRRAILRVTMIVEVVDSIKDALDSESITSHLFDVAKAMSETED